MKKQLTTLLLIVVFLPLVALSQNCVDFESLTLGQEYGTGINSPGDVIFTESDISVAVEDFYWTNGGSTFGLCHVADGSGGINSGQDMSISNINLLFDFAGIGYVPNRVTFDFLDQGGNENISVNGSQIHAGELFDTLIAPGVYMTIIDVGTYKKGVLTGPVTKLLIGGQEFTLDNVCAELVEDPSDCVDFELLPLGAHYGAGYNGIGDVIFTENDIPVSVEYFNWTSGGTFGTCTVIDGTSSFGSDQAMWTSNINLRFDFTGLSQTPNQITFDFTDEGGYENISVNGEPVFVGELGIAAMPAGYNLFISDMGTYQRATIMGQAPITELLIGGQEFAIDNICTSYVEFETYCVDFETLNEGDMFGAGYNSPGDEIFTQNGFSVSVQNFVDGVGGTYFGTAEVMSNPDIGTGNSMRQSNINLLYNFMIADVYLNMITFDFADYGGFENLSVNGDGIYYGELEDAVVPQGFSIHVNKVGNAGSVTIEGPIVSLIVGGQEFFIDNICAYAIVSVEEPVTADADVVVSQNYPNPFDHTTVIPFEVNKQTHVTVTVYDYLGRVIAELADSDYAPGNYKLNWNAGNLPDGIYFYRLRTSELTITKKMSLVR